MIVILLTLLIGILCWAAITFAGRMAPGHRVPLAVAVMLGLSAYLLLGSPGEPGAPKPPPVAEGFGEALTDPRNGLGGMVTPAAEMAFQRAADIEPAHPAPQFFFGLALAQSGDVGGARAIWQSLLDRSPPNAPWREDLSSRLAMLPPAAPSAAPTSTPAPATPAVPPRQGD